MRLNQEMKLVLWMHLWHRYRTRKLFDLSHEVIERLNWKLKLKRSLLSFTSNNDERIEVLNKIIVQRGKVC